MPIFIFPFSNGHLSKQASRRLAALVLVAFFVGTVLVLRFRASGPSLPDESFANKEEVVLKATPVSTPEPSEGFSPFSLQEFHRSETQDGKTLWDAKGDNARYFLESNSVKIDNGHLVFQTEDGTPVTIRSDQATLFLEGAGFREVDARGSVVLIHNNETTMTTEQVLYTKESQRAHAPGQVRIVHSMMEIEGKELEADFESQTFTLKRDVSSVIYPRNSEEKTKRAPSEKRKE